MAQITLTNVGVEFPIHNASSRSLQLHLFNALGGRLAEHKRAVVVRALDGITVSFRDGDRIGVIGQNGAGKTTFLRVLAGVYEPTTGAVATEGRLSSFTNITLGMDPEATGLENIIFRCVFLGLSFAEARRRSGSIAEFSGLGEYLRLPVRTYSAGMFLRLAFAISTTVESDIVVMDEMVAAGDAQFLAKAQERLSAVLNRASILVMATHNAIIMRKLCNKVLWLQQGRLRQFGEFEDVYSSYCSQQAAVAA
jgi:ABC-type polysaccharide/polyol phosphate transport system ATPase subunit